MVPAPGRVAAAGFAPSSPSHGPRTTAAALTTCDGSSGDAISGRATDQAAPSRNTSDPATDHASTVRLRGTRAGTDAPSAPRARVPAAATSSCGDGVCMVDPSPVTTTPADRLGRRKSRAGGPGVGSGTDVLRYACGHALRAGPARAGCAPGLERSRLAARRAERDPRSPPSRRGGGRQRRLRRCDQRGGSCARGAGARPTVQHRRWRRDACGLPLRPCQRLRRRHPGGCVDARTFSRPALATSVEGRRLPPAGLPGARHRPHSPASRLGWGVHRMSGYLFALVGAVVTLGFMVELLRRRRLREKYAALWIAVAVVVMIGVLFPSLLERAISSARVWVSC